MQIDSEALLANFTHNIKCNSVTGQALNNPECLLSDCVEGPFLYLPLCCSFMVSNRLWVLFVIFHTRTCPSPPPLMIRWQSDMVAKAVTPIVCALLISYISFPLWGVKARILPSFQPMGKRIMNCCWSYNKGSIHNLAGTGRFQLVCTTAKVVLLLTSAIASDTFLLIQLVECTVVWKLEVLTSHWELYSIYYG